MYKLSPENVQVLYCCQFILTLSCNPMYKLSPEDVQMFYCCRFILTLSRNPFYKLSPEDVQVLYCCRFILTPCHVTRCTNCHLKTYRCSIAVGSSSLCHVTRCTSWHLKIYRCCIAVSLTRCLLNALRLSSTQSFLCQTMLSVCIHTAQRYVRCTHMYLMFVHFGGHPHNAWKVYLET